MKKLLAFVLALSMLLGATALAEDLGIQVIGGPNVNTETLSLDDMKLEQTYTIDGYARIKPTVWNFTDFFYQYAKDHAGDNTNREGKAGVNPWSYNAPSAQYYKHINIMKSGANAEFAWLEMEVTNLGKEGMDFTQQATVKVVFDEEYEFAGWVRMENYDYDTHDGNKFLVRSVLDPANSEMTEMMYTCHMVFGCTLPNAVVEGKEPLQMIITLGGNELTYNIRK